MALKPANDKSFEPTTSL